MLIVSTNEIESLVFKSTRGAGMSWGIAEDASKAARTLAQFGLPWESGLCDILEGFSSGTFEPIANPGHQQQPQSDQHWLCPLRTGIHLCDFAGRADRYHFRRVARPLWLLPFVVDCSRATETRFELRWRDMSFLADPRGQASYRSTSGMVADDMNADEVFVAAAAASPTSDFKQLAVSRGGREVSAIGWQRLQEYEWKTYVPASDASRVSGAGAGSGDNE